MEKKSRGRGEKNSKKGKEIEISKIICHSRESGNPENMDNSNITPEEVIKKLEEIIKTYFIKKQCIGSGLIVWNEELARRGSEKFNTFIRRYFEKHCHDGGYLIQTESLIENDRVKDVQSRIDMAFGRINAFTEDIKEHGYNWEEYHIKKPPQPTKIEHWLNVNKNFVNLIKSIIPAFIAIFFVITGDYKEANLGGIGLLLFAIIVTYIPELKDLFRRKI